MICTRLESTNFLLHVGRTSAEKSAINTFERAVIADPSLSDLANMGVEVSTDGVRGAGVPVGIDDSVKAFVAKKARAVIMDVAQLDVVTDGLIHIQLLNFFFDLELLIKH